MIEIELQETGRNGRYEARVPGYYEVGVLTYRRPDARTVIADHTGVPDSLGGRGIGQALVERLMSDARARDFKVVPRCPFVRATAEKHPEWADLLKTSTTSTKDA